MIKQISLALVFALTSVTASADSRRADYQNPASKQETTGTISGAILGGIAGGPPGLIYESELRLAALKEESQAMQASHQLTVKRLEGMSLNRARTYPANIQMPTTGCCDDTLLSLNFRSGSSAIEPHYEEQLASLIKIAEQMPAARVEILNSAGIQNSSIRTIAHGETKPLHFAQNFESDFFDRRVIVRLRDNSTSMLTQNPDGE
jgi:outer membrane protein OmpA-like peptidoglycan-associated protein